MGAAQGSEDRVEERTGQRDRASRRREGHFPQPVTPEDLLQVSRDASHLGRVSPSVVSSSRLRSARPPAPQDVRLLSGSAVKPGIVHAQILAGPPPPQLAEADLSTLGSSSSSDEGKERRRSSQSSSSGASGKGSDLSESEDDERASRWSFFSDLHESFCQATPDAEASPKAAARAAPSPKKRQRARGGMKKDRAGGMKKDRARDGSWGAFNAKDARGRSQVALRKDVRQVLKSIASVCDMGRTSALVLCSTKERCELLAEELRIREFCTANPVRNFYAEKARLLLGMRDRVQLPAALPTSDSEEEEEFMLRYLYSDAVCAETIYAAHVGTFKIQVDVNLHPGADSDKGYFFCDERRAYLEDCMDASLLLVVYW